MYSPAIEFVIFTIFHVFSRYRSIAGKHIKNRPHTLQCFADFLQNVFGRFSWLAVTQSTHIPREPQCLSPRPNWDSPPPLPQANVGADDWRKRLALYLLCGLHKIREKYIKRYEELSSIIDVYNRHWEKIKHVSSRYRIFDAGGHMIRSEHMKSCLTAQICFLLFKGPGSFKIFFKICGNVE